MLTTTYFKKGIMKTNLLKKAYVAPEVKETTRYGEKEFLQRIPPQFDEDERHLMSFWRKGIKWLQVERVL